MKTRISLAVIVIALAAGMLALMLVGCGSSSVDVTIDDNGTITEVSVEQGKTVADALAAADIEIGENDLVTPALDTKVEAGTNKIEIQRCVSVTVVDGAQSTDVELVGATVADALTSAHVTLANGDTVDVDLEAPLQDGMVITVTRAQAASQPADVSESGYSSYGEGDTASSDAAASTPQERTLVSKTPVPNCNDENHGYYEILYSDGSIEYEEY